MPLSASVATTGTLDETLHGFVLRTDGGGLWELGHLRGVRPLLGCRVRVEGSRCGFNAIACSRIWREGERRPRSPMVSIGAIAISVIFACSLFLAGAGFLIG